MGSLFCLLVRFATKRILVFLVRFSSVIPFSLSMAVIFFPLVCVSGSGSGFCRRVYLVAMAWLSS